ncbi:VCBS repeat-containing protein [Halobacillus salinarum]|uniref:VCBS repeat-containing protein n=1 Tax=Halobacillus salinarum TaxID=2932257 RepID=A0ABY4EKB3_9BACI|nr:VCBS repeat-containing protein [Halobacillus salinarum]UOQ43967.1 VCBS repeat-containing protein [Halobacillus salinarum]
MYNYFHPYAMREPNGESYILAFQQGDVNGDYIQDNVYLVGQKNSSSPFVQDITLIIQDGKTNQFFSVPLKTNEGYQPTLFLGDFTGDGVDDILISIDSGGSGGYGFYYAYSFVENKPKLLFDFEQFNREFNYDVLYKDYYKVEVINNTLALQFIIDISGRGNEYLSEIYDTSGKLTTPINGWVSGLNRLYPIDFQGDGVYELYALQRIAGRYSADGLGLIQTALSWNGSSFTAEDVDQQAAIFGTSIKNEPS